MTPALARLPEGDAYATLEALVAERAPHRSDTCLLDRDEWLAVVALSGSRRRRRVLFGRVVAYEGSER